MTRDAAEFEKLLEGTRAFMLEIAIPSEERVKPASLVANDSERRLSSHREEVCG